MAGVFLKKRKEKLRSLHERPPQKKGYDNSLFSERRQIREVSIRSMRFADLYSGRDWGARGEERASGTFIPLVESPVNFPVKKENHF